MQVISCLDQKECKSEAVCWRPISVAMTSQSEDSHSEGPAGSVVDKVS